jgi:aromatic ring-cleaving dioxygenase
MYLISKTIGTTLLMGLFCIGISTAALSVGTEVYDKPNVQLGKTIKGKVTDVDPKDSQTWQVSVMDADSGKLIMLHVDKTTTRKDIMLSPKVGDNVVAKYDDRNHAISFLTDQTMNR